MKKVLALFASAVLAFTLMAGTAEAQRGWDRRVDHDTSKVKKADNKVRGWDRKVNRLQGTTLSVKKSDVRGWDRRGWDRRGWDLSRRGWD